jgi:23S rRNA (guanine2445-N2)-methyltransferase / 23S rRNA (guanine2069-N7)-methyltransferase
VNFEDYLDTGLFLDHRITRSKLGELAKAKRFLNLFAYTGTATVYAARGGATATTTVDMSNTYLEWAQKNMSLNGYSPDQNQTKDQHQFIQANCIQWLKNNTKQDRYDLIFLDPPSFSSSKRMESTFDVQRDHASLIQDTAKLLTANGLLIFSNNLRHFKMDDNIAEKFQVNDITKETIPKDFERNPRIHNCWEIRIR